MVTPWPDLVARIDKRRGRIVGAVTGHVDGAPVGREPAPGELRHGEIDAALMEVRSARRAAPR